MKREIVSRITPGAVYVHHEMRAVKRDGERIVEDVEGYRARIVTFAVDAVTRRELVVYVCLEGPQDGRVGVASLAYFAQHFRAVPEPSPVAEPVTEPLPDKPAGAHELGSGV